MDLVGKSLFDLIPPEIIEEILVYLDSVDRVILKAVFPAVVGEEYDVNEVLFNATRNTKLDDCSRLVRFGRADPDVIFLAGLLIPEDSFLTIAVHLGSTLNFQLRMRANADDKNKIWELVFKRGWPFLIEYILREGRPHQRLEFANEAANRGYLYMCKKIMTLFVSTGDYELAIHITDFDALRLSLEFHYSDCDMYRYIGNCLGIPQSEAFHSIALKILGCGTRSLASESAPRYSRIVRIGFYLTLIEESEKGIVDLIDLIKNPRWNRIDRIIHHAPKFTPESFVELFEKWSNQLWRWSWALWINVPGNCQIFKDTVPKI